jgi:hypothetical protein
VVFFGADDNPVGGLFVGLSVVYFCDFFASLGHPRWERLLGLAHIATAVAHVPDDSGRAQHGTGFQPPAVSA